MTSPRSAMGSAKVSISSIVSGEEGESQDGTDELDLAKALRPATPLLDYPSCKPTQHLPARRPLPEISTQTRPKADESLISYLIFNTLII